MHIHIDACTHVYTHKIHTCMHTYIYSCIHIHLNTVIYIDIVWHNYTYIYVYIHTYIVYSHTYIQMYMYVCLYMYVYVCMYMYACICMYICMYVYVCMHNILEGIARGKCPTQNGRGNCPGELSGGKLSYTPRFKSRPVQKFEKRFLRRAHSCSASVTTTPGTRASSKSGNSPSASEESIKLVQIRRS